MKKYAFLFSILSATAFAKVETSQTLMPSRGQSETTLEMKSRSGVFKINNIDLQKEGSVRESTFIGNASYYFGVIEKGALGLELQSESSSRSYSSPDFTSESTKEGVGDVVLRYKGRLDVGESSFYYGLGYSISPTPSIYDAKNEHDNVASGQNAVVVSGAVVVPVANWNWGGSVEYHGKEEGHYHYMDEDGTTEKYISKNGSMLSSRVFVELENRFHPNLAVANLRTYSQIRRSQTATADSLGSDLYGVELSGRYRILPSMELIPSLSYYRLENSDIDVQWDYNAYVVGLQTRMSF